MLPIFSDLISGRHSFVFFFYTWKLFKTRILLNRYPIVDDDAIWIERSKNCATTSFVDCVIKFFSFRIVICAIYYFFFNFNKLSISFARVNLKFVEGIVFETIEFDKLSLIYFHSIEILCIEKLNLDLLNRSN